MKVTLPRSAARAGVTVVVPCYRYGHYLRGIVAGILAQKDVDARVIIVDDASPDDSANVARSIARDDPRVTVLVHERNAGHIATYNDGLALVETEFVSLVSADDLVAPGALGRATRLMTAHPEVGMVYGAVVDFVDDGVPNRDYRRGSETWTVWPGPQWFRRVASRGRNPILSPEVVMRTAALRDVGPYDPALPHSGDLEYWLRTAAGWDVGRVNGSAQAYYRVHGANMHIEHFEATAEDLRQRWRAFASAGALSGMAVESASAALAREALRDARGRLDRGATSDSVAPLVDFATERVAGVLDGSLGRSVTRRMRRADAGLAPAAAQRGLEFVRFQLDRVRWKGRDWFGVGRSHKTKPESAPATIATADA